MHVSTYVEDLKSKHKTAIVLTHKHLGKAQNRMKNTFDKTKKPEIRSFSDG